MSAVIVICDADPASRSELAALLERHGYGVRTASSGEGVVRIARNERVNAVVIDVLVPEVNGWEVVAALRSRAETRSVPIVIVSLFAAADHEQAAFQVEGWVQKPTVDSDLVHVIERALSRPVSDPPRVLVVEDNDMTAAILRATFERSGVSVFRAITGVEAVEMAVWTRPDLLVLDVLLPDMDGFSVVKWLRKHDALRDLPVIVFSGAEVSAAEIKRLELGRTEFLPKGKYSISAVEETAMKMIRETPPTGRNSSPDYAN